MRLWYRGRIVFWERICAIGLCGPNYTGHASTAWWPSIGRAKKPWQTAGHEDVSPGARHAVVRTARLPPHLAQEPQRLRCVGQTGPDRSETSPIDVAQEVRDGFVDRKPGRFVSKERSDLQVVDRRLLPELEIAALDQ